MQMQIKGRFGANHTVNYDGAPDHCPVCHHAVQPTDTSQNYIVPNDRVEVVFRCPNFQCERYFIVRYTVKEAGKNFYSFSEAVPLTIETTDYDGRIKDISKDFVAVYRQAEEAELRNLKLVCGPGYRKALEFLIKDYVISRNPSKDDSIKKMPLGQCISNYVKDGNVKEVAKRAVWLGNDEVHYLRKWDEKELKDLKTLIELTVHWIEMEKLTEEAIKDMPEGK